MAKKQLRSRSAGKGKGQGKVKRNKKPGGKGTRKREPTITTSMSGEDITEGPKLKVQEIKYPYSRHVLRLTVENEKEKLRDFYDEVRQFIGVLKGRLNLQEVEFREVTRIQPPKTDDTIKEFVLMWENKQTTTLEDMLNWLKDWPRPLGTITNGKGIDLVQWSRPLDPLKELEFLDNPVTLG